MDAIWMDYGREFYYYLFRHLAINRDMYLLETTRALTIDQYRDHLKAMLYMESHYALQQDLFQTIPHLTQNRNAQVLFDAANGDISDISPYVVKVDTFGQTRTLIELHCSPYSTRNNVRRSMIEDFPGQTACIALVYRQKEVA